MAGTNQCFTSVLFPCTFQFPPLRELSVAAKPEGECLHGDGLDQGISLNLVHEDRRCSILRLETKGIGLGKTDRMSVFRCWNFLSIPILYSRC